MEIALIVSQGLYDAMVLEKTKISQEDEMEVTRVFISKSGECFLILEK